MAIWRGDGSLFEIHHVVDIHHSCLRQAREDRNQVEGVHVRATRTR